MSNGSGGARVPPQALDAERAVLGAMLLEKDSINRAMEKLPEDGSAFYDERNKAVYLAMIGLHDRGVAVDIITLSGELEKGGRLESLGGATFLDDLLSSVATSAHLEHHLRLVLDKYVLRRLISASTLIVQRSYEGADDVATLVDRAEKDIFDISESRIREGFIPMRSIVMDSFATIQELYDQKRRITGVPSGFVDLDELTTGFQKSDLVIVAGRPSMGKTSFALNCALHSAIEGNVPTAVFSLEMSREQLVQRFLSSEARVDLHRLRSGHLRDKEWGQLTTAAGLLHEAPLYVDDSAGLTVLEMRAKARRLKHEEPDLGLIIVDYLQLIRGGGRFEGRTQEISHISQSLKALAKELKVPVMALSQLSRAVETRGGERRPMLSDLRESGAIEQDADLVMFVYRQEHYEPEREDVRGLAELIVGKQRNGPIGTVRLTFIKDYARFENLARAREPVAG
jgi:replicative DNA helicase